MVQVNLLRGLWRGEVQLWKVFWIFGFAVLMLFSFTFITSQGLIAAMLGKSSNTPLYLDCFLAFSFVVYGIFTIVAIWRSANKYQGHRIWSHLSKLTSIVVVLWFSANIGLYLVVKITIPPALEAVTDYVPEKLKLPDSEIEADSLYFGDFKLKFPFYKEDIETVSPFFMEHRPNIGIFLSNEKGMINFGEIQDHFPEANTSMRDKISNWLVDERDFGSYLKTMELVHYATLKDYSWWNLRSNLRLAPKLVLKAISIPAFGDSKAYEVETPHLRGYLRKGQSIKNNRIMIDFVFGGQGKSHTLFAATADEKVANKIMSMLSTIQPVANIDEGFAEMEAQYRHKDKARYPDKLLLISLISLKGPTVDNLKELLRMAEDSHDNQFAIDTINQEIKSLSHPLK